MAEYFFFTAHEICSHLLYIWEIKTLIFHMVSNVPEMKVDEEREKVGGRGCNNQLLTYIFLVFYNFATWRVGTLVELYH